MIIEENRDYKYLELCEYFNESKKTGNAKKAQLKRWKTVIDWINPTTQG